MEDLEGLSKLLATLEKFKDLDVSKIASAGGYTILTEAVKNAPVRTGYMRSTGYVDPIEGKGCEIGFSADYSFYVEMGSTRQRAQPYLRPAIDTKANEAIQSMGKEAIKDIRGKI